MFGLRDEAIRRLFHEDVVLSAAFELVTGRPVDKVRLLAELCLEDAAPPFEACAGSALLAELEGVRHVLVVEARTEQDPHMFVRWPYYVSYLHARYRCPVAAVVVTPKLHTAQWARRPITLEVPEPGSTMSMRLAVFGPDNVPLVRDPMFVRYRVGLALIATVVHGRSGAIGDILEMLDEALKDLGADTARRCTVLVEAALEDPGARRKWKELMSFEDLEDRSEIVATWTARGEARALLRVLEAREIRISDEFRQRIRFCDDENQIRVWLRRAATATDEADLLH